MRKSKKLVTVVLAVALMVMFAFPVLADQHIIDENTEVLCVMTAEGIKEAYGRSIPINKGVCTLDFLSEDNGRSYIIRENHPNEILIYDKDDAYIGTYPILGWFVTDGEKYAPYYERK